MNAIKKSPLAPMASADVYPSLTSATLTISLNRVVLGKMAYVSSSTFESQRAGLVVLVFLALGGVVGRPVTDACSITQWIGIDLPKNVKDGCNKLV